jgi:hypothetical protein
MSDIKAVQDFLLSYQSLEDDRPVWVEMLGEEPLSYTVFLVPGKQVEEDIIGNKTVSYPFGFGAVEVIADNSALLAAEFYEAFADWLDEQTESGNLPTLDTGKTAISIEALDTATIIERAEKTGVFQILCKLVYEM